MITDPTLGYLILSAQAAGDTETVKRLEADPDYQARRARLRDLERMLRETTDCSHPTSRQAIAKAMRLRRGQAIETDKRGGFNPANAGDNHWKRHK
jgi:hypothetical protein